MNTTVQNLSLPDSTHLYQNLQGQLESVLINEEVEWMLSCGPVVPQYDITEGGRRIRTPVYFYNNGYIRSLPLHMRSPVAVGEEILPAELITFYATGEVRRVFPSAGKLSAYWTEEQEKAACPAVDILIGTRREMLKCINIEFHPSGTIASITLWPGEVHTFTTNVGEIKVRTGVAFYENGNVRSYEPAESVDVNTPVGVLKAFHSSPIGISGDMNSLRYSENGQVESLITMESIIHVNDGEKDYEFGPQKIVSYCEEAETEVRGMQVSFKDATLIISGKTKQEFALDKITASVGKSKLVWNATSCSGH